MSDRRRHRIEGWEYDAGRELLVALLDDDRERFDECLESRTVDRPEVLADLIAIALTVAGSRRFRYYVIHRRPSDETCVAFLFGDLFDRELASMVINALYQRVSRGPVVPTNDLPSMTTCLAIGGCPALR